MCLWLVVSNQEMKHFSNWIAVYSSCFLSIQILLVTVMVQIPVCGVDGFLYTLTTREKQDVQIKINLSKSSLLCLLAI